MLAADRFLCRGLPGGESIVDRNTDGREPEPVLADAMEHLHEKRIVRGSRQRDRAGVALRRALPRPVHERLRAVARRRPSVRPPLDPRVRAGLLERFDDDLIRLEELLQRDLSGWRA